MTRVTAAATHRRTRWLLAFGLVLAVLAAAGLRWPSSGAPGTVVQVGRGDLTALLTTSGVLKPVQAITYRSPLTGRDAEIIELVAEGTLVQEGDLLARLDTTGLLVELERGYQEQRQADAELQLASIERQEADATIASVAEGEGALTVEEAKGRLQASQKRVDRLREEHAQLEPLMKKGFITREELRKTGDALEAAEDELVLVRKRTDVLVGLTRPRDLQRARVQRAQKQSSLEQATTKLTEIRARLNALKLLVDSASIYARRPGLVIHEEFLQANPRRKVRVGDRVTSSQGLATIPEVDRMLVETSVSEAELRRVRVGQTAAVRVEAFPDLRLTGAVTRVGTLARASADRPFDEKRFELVVELHKASPELRPEMTARADILLGQRSNVLLLPVTAIFGQQRGFVAYVPGRRAPDTRQLEIGETDGRFVEVVSGLAEGESVLLTEPNRDGGRRTAPSTPPMPARSVGGG